MGEPPERGEVAPRIRRKRWLQGTAIAILGLTVFGSLQFGITARTMRRDTGGGSSARVAYQRDELTMEGITAEDRAATVEIVARVAVTDVYPILFNTLGGAAPDPARYDNVFDVQYANHKNRLVLSCI